MALSSFGLDYNTIEFLPTFDHLYEKISSSCCIILKEPVVDQALLEFIQKIKPARLDFAAAFPRSFFIVSAKFAPQISEKFISMQPVWVPNITRLSFHNEATINKIKKNQIKIKLNKIGVY